MGVHKGALFSGVLMTAVVGPAPATVEASLAGDAVAIGATDASGRSRLAAIDSAIAARLSGSRPVLVARAPVARAPRLAPNPAVRLGPTARSTVSPGISDGITRVFPYSVAFAVPAPVPVILWQPAADAMFPLPANAPTIVQDVTDASRTASASPAPASAGDADFDRFIAAGLPRPAMLSGGSGGARARGSRARQPAAQDDPGLLAPLVFQSDPALFAFDFGAGVDAVATPASGTFALFGLGALVLLRRRARLR